MRNLHVKVASILTALVVIAVVVFLAASRDNRYPSPDEAVRASCHAAKILDDYSRGGSPVRVGWQRKGQPEGVGWVALVDKSDFGYRVQSCNTGFVTHG